MELLENIACFVGGGLAGWLIALGVYWPERCSITEALHLRREQRRRQTRG